MGEFWLRKLAKHVIQGKFSDSERPVAVRFSQCDFGLVVQALDDAAGELLLGLEVVEQQLPVRMTAMMTADVDDVDRAEGAMRGSQSLT